MFFCEHCGQELHVTTKWDGYRCLDVPVGSIINLTNPPDDFDFLGEPYCVNPECPLSTATSSKKTKRSQMSRIIHSVSWSGASGIAGGVLASFVWAGIEYFFGGSQALPDGIGGLTLVLGMAGLPTVKEAHSLPIRESEQIDSVRRVSKPRTP